MQKWMQITCLPISQQQSLSMSGMHLTKDSVMPITQNSRCFAWICIRYLDLSSFWHGVEDCSSSTCYMVIIRLVFFFKKLVFIHCRIRQTETALPWTNVQTFLSFCSLSSCSLGAQLIISLCQILSITK